MELLGSIITSEPESKVLDRNKATNNFCKILLHIGVLDIRQSNIFFESNQKNNEYCKSCTLKCEECKKNIEIKLEFDKKDYIEKLDKTFNQHQIIELLGRITEKNYTNMILHFYFSLDIKTKNKYEVALFNNYTFIKTIEVKQYEQRNDSRNTKHY